MVSHIFGRTPHSPQNFSIRSMFLSIVFKLALHPQKVYLQHYSKGVLFVGSMIKPNKCYIRKRTLGYFYQKVQMLNEKLHQATATNNPLLLRGVLSQFPSTVNSYLGFLMHYRSYQMRKHFVVEVTDPMFRNHFACNENVTKIIPILRLE
jgi:hypothetical protein